MAKLFSNIGRVAVGGCALAIITGCGTPDLRAIQRLIQDRVGPSGSVTVSEIVIYRSGDMRKACASVTRRNPWGETQPSERVIAWYVWNTRIWNFDNFQRADDGLNCAEYAARNGQIS